jgi:hypothetical protein
MTLRLLSFFAVAMFAGAPLGVPASPVPSHMISVKKPVPAATATPAENAGGKQCKHPRCIKKHRAAPSHP